MPSDSTTLRPLTTTLVGRIKQHPDWEVWKTCYGIGGAMTTLGGKLKRGQKTVQNLMEDRAATIDSAVAQDLATWLGCDVGDIAVPVDSDHLVAVSVPAFLEKRLSSLLAAQRKTFDWWAASKHRESVESFVDEALVQRKLRTSEVGAFELPPWVAHKDSEVLNGFSRATFPRPLMEELGRRRWSIACPTCFVGAVAVLFGLRAMFPDVEFEFDFSATQAVEFTERIIARQGPVGQNPPLLIVGADGLLLQTLNPKLRRDCQYGVLAGCQPLPLFVVRPGREPWSLPDPHSVRDGRLALDTSCENTQHLWWKSRSKVWRRWNSVGMHPSELLGRLADQQLATAPGPSLSSELFMAYSLHAEFVQSVGFGTPLPLPKATHPQAMSKSAGFIVCQRHLRTDNQGKAAKAIFTAIQSVQRAMSNPHAGGFREKVEQFMQSDPFFCEALENTLGIHQFNSRQPR